MADERPSSCNRNLPGAKYLLGLAQKAGGQAGKPLNPFFSFWEILNFYRVLSFHRIAAFLPALAPPKANNAKWKKKHNANYGPGPQTGEKSDK